MTLHERLAAIERQIEDTAERLKDFPTHTYPCRPGDRCAACLARLWMAGSARGPGSDLRAPTGEPMTTRYACDCVRCRVRRIVRRAVWIDSDLLAFVIVGIVVAVAAWTIVAIFAGLVF